MCLEDKWGLRIFGIVVGTWYLKNALYEWNGSFVIAQ
jgi:hypothetical protein